MLSMATMFFACGSDGSKGGKDVELDDATELAEDQKEANVTINGVIANGEHLSIALEALSDKGVVLINRTAANDKGEFQLKGHVQEIGLYQLRVEDGKQPGETVNSVPLTLVPGDELGISLDYNNFNFDVSYAGTEWAEAMNGYMEKMKEFNEWQATIDNVEQYYVPERQGELIEMIMKNKAPMDQFIVDEINKNPTNPAHVLLMTNLLPVGGFDYYDEGNIEALTKVLNGYEEKYPGKVVTESIGIQIAQLKQGFNDYKALANNEAPEIELPNPDGKNMRLSDLRGNYVLIDFWASWCMPCRVENPNVVRLYNKYKKYNFEMFSVSLDDNKANWIQAIKDDNLTWDNHVSDLLKWQTPLVNTYQFNGIPHTVLVDPEGKIIARNLRGPSLEKKLQELFGA